MHRIAGELQPTLAKLFPGPHVKRGQRTVGLCARWPQQHPAAGVIGVVSANIGASDDGTNQRINFGFAQRMVAAAVHVGGPSRRKVAVQVERLRRVRDGNGEPIVIDDFTFVHDPISGDIGGRSVDRNRHHQSPVLGGLHPRTIRVNNAHAENAAVAVHILLVQSAGSMGVVPRPSSSATAAILRTVSKRPFDTVWIHTGYHVKRASLQGPSDGGVGAVARNQMIDQAQRSNAGSDLDRVNVGIDPMSRLAVVAARVAIGDGG